MSHQTDKIRLYGRWQETEVPADGGLLVGQRICMFEDG